MEKQYECEDCGEKFEGEHDLTHHKCPAGERCECCGGPPGLCSTYEDGVPIGMLDPDGNVC